MNCDKTCEGCYIKGNVLENVIREIEMYASGKLTTLYMDSINEAIMLTDQVNMLRDSNVKIVNKVDEIIPKQEIDMSLFALRIYFYKILLVVCPEINSYDIATIVVDELNNCIVSRDNAPRDNTIGENAIGENNTPLFFTLCPRILALFLAYRSDEMFLRLNTRHRVISSLILFYFENCMIGGVWSVDADTFLWPLLGEELRIKLYSIYKAKNNKLINDTAKRMWLDEPKN